MTSRTGRIARGLGGVAAWVLAVAGLVLLAGLGVLPHTGWYRTVTVLSGSMRPGIPEGSVAVLTPERPRDLRPGQVITYQVPGPGGQVLTHRVVSIVEGLGSDHPVVRTKGDANSAPDPLLARIDDARVWRVRASVPHLGTMVTAMRRPAVRAAAVQFVPAVLAVVCLTAIWRRPQALPAG